MSRTGTVPRKGQKRGGWTREDREQQALVQWFRLQYPALRRLLFSVPNGARTSPAVAGRLKATGLQAGVPDLLLAVPRPPLPGLFLEMKTRTPGGDKSYPDIHQRSMHKLLREQGYAVVVVWGWLEGREVITNYLAGLPLTPAKQKA